MKTACKLFLEKMTASVMKITSKTVNDDEEDNDDDDDDDEN